MGGGLAFPGAGVKVGAFSIPLVACRDSKVLILIERFQLFEHFLSGDAFFSIRLFQRFFKLHLQGLRKANGGLSAFFWRLR
jgi:hypothetical protein